MMLVAVAAVATASSIVAGGSSGGQVLVVVATRPVVTSVHFVGSALHRCHLNNTRALMSYFSACVSVDGRVMVDCPV